MSIHKLVNMGEANKRKLRDIRLSHINMVYSAIKDALFQGDLYIQIYELSRQLLSNLQQVARELEICRDTCGKGCRWLLKGVLRYYFLAEGEDKAAYRYIFGSSSRDATFCSRIYYDIVRGTNLRNFIDLITLPLKGDGEFENVNIREVARKAHTNRYYLIVYIYNIVVEGTEIKDLVQDCLTGLGCTIIYRGKLEVG